MYQTRTLNFSAVSQKFLLLSGANMEAAVAHFHPEAAASTLIMWPEGRDANQPMLSEAH